MTTPAIISVRRASTRLPNKCLLEFGDGTVLGHVIERAKAYGLQPVVATTVLPEDDIIIDIADNRGALIVRGPVNNKLLRWQSACKQHGFDRFITVDADDPFFDPELNMLSLSTLEKDGYDAISPCTVEGPYLGSHGWSLTLQALERSSGRVPSEMIQNQLDPWLKVKKLSGFACEAIESDIRLTLDYQEDYWLLRTVLRELGPLCSRKDIVRFFKENPGLTRLNKFRNAEWIANQHIQ